MFLLQKLCVKIAILATVIWSGTFSYLILKLIDNFIGLRVTSDEEVQGLDIALHCDDTGKIFKHRIRMYGIDTPEMHPSLSNSDRAKEIEASKQSREALTQRLQENDNLVVAHFHKFDKYGRLMATLYDKQGEDINKWMISAGYAQEYFGKTKKKFVERLPLMVSECDHDYFDTPRNSEPSEGKTAEAFKEEAKERVSDESEMCEFEEFPADITEEAKNNIHIV